MIYPPAIWNPGRNSGYNAGRNAMRACVCHYTVGRDSTLIGVDGYFHFLVSRDGTVQQFAELDAVCWHAGDPYNSLGPSIEVEYLDEPEMFTPAQLDACGHLVRWVADQGITLHYYDTGGDNDRRVWEFDGFLSHRACQSSADWHYDYWEQADWDRMVGAGPPPYVEDDDMPKGVLTHDDTGAWWALSPAGTRYRVWNQEQVDALADLEFIANRVPAFYNAAFLNLFRVIQGPDPLDLE